jgi:S-methylmethionine-dependent homocysteine/selenocysteine methylase
MMRPSGPLERISRGETILLDGGIGSELQARGVPMDGAVWCGTANLSHLDAVRSVHSAYIEAGATVITTNTFACNRAAFEPAGLGDLVEQANRNAVSAARQARDAAADGPVAIAGSISALCAVTMDRVNRNALGTDELGEDALRPSSDQFREQAWILAEAGVDLIVLEMMNSASYGERAIEAALTTGLPVWLGVSPFRNANGTLGSVQEVPARQTEFGTVLARLADDRLAAVNVMHCKMSVVSDALQAVRERFKGTIGAYPESGDWAPPNWIFAEVSPEEYAAEARSWVAEGAQIIGGCCGIRPDHIGALSESAL